MASLSALAPSDVSTACAPEPLPITERENELTRELDAASPLGVVRLLRQTDAQVFSGYLDYPGLADDIVRRKIVRSIDIVSGVLTRYRAITEDVLETLPSSSSTLPAAAVVPRVIMSGSGTSGRLGFLIAREMNRVVASVTNIAAIPTADRSSLPPPFGYCVSGGDPALLLSDELPEDDPVAGVADWLRETGRKGDCDGSDSTVPNGSCLIGITCGLSAPYVAGQVDHILDHANDSTTNKDSAILMGFNPASLSRNKPIEIWKHDPERQCAERSLTVRDVVLRLVEAEEKEQEGAESASPSSFCLLNPVVGPEPVCASSRMKGGTCTKILLDVVLATAVARVYGLPLLHWPACIDDKTAIPQPLPPVREQVDAILDAFASAYAATYASSAPAISRVLERCGQSLRRRSRQDAGNSGASDEAGGHIYWSGAGAAGILAAIDASEMPDTYGAAFDETRAFVFGGWHGIGVTQSDPHTLSRRHPLLRISYTDFVEDVLGGEIGRVRNVPTPQLLRYRKGAIKLTGHDTLIDVCDVWPSSCDGIDGGDLVRRGVTDGILGGDATMPLTMCVDPHSFSSAQQDCPWRKARVGFAYLVDGRDDVAKQRDAVTYGDLSVQLPRPPVWLLPGKYCGFDTLMLKLALNAISTGAQCMKGMVYQNHMINVGPTNAKIFDRCVRLISRFAKVPLAAAHTALLRAVYEEDVDVDKVGVDCGGGNTNAEMITPALLSERVLGTTAVPRTQSDHIKKFSPPPNASGLEYKPAKSVLPLAIVLAAKGLSCSCHEAAQVLKRNPSVRLALKEVAL